jgi:hypothetical protein
MRWSVTLVAEIEPGQTTEHEIASVNREDRITPATLGLSIAEGKAVLAAIQAQAGRGPGHTPWSGRAALSGVWSLAVLQGALPVDLSVGLRQRADAGAAVSRVPVPHRWAEDGAGALHPQIAHRASGTSPPSWRR